MNRFTKRLTGILALLCAAVMTAVGYFGETLPDSYYVSGDGCPELGGLFSMTPASADGAVSRSRSHRKQPAELGAAVSRNIVAVGERFAEIPHSRHHCGAEQRKYSRQAFCKPVHFKNPFLSESLLPRYFSQGTKKYSARGSCIIFIVRNTHKSFPLSAK